MFDPLSSPFDNAEHEQWGGDSQSLPQPPPSAASTTAIHSSSPDTPTRRNILPPNPSSPYGREPQIYGAPSPGLIAPPNGAGKGGGYLRVRVTALDRNRRDIMVRMDAQTNLPAFTGTSYRGISRSYLEFQTFHSQIVYSNPQTIISALPLAQTSAATDEEDDRIIKIMLQRWLGRICDDPVVLRDDELRSFIESEFGYQAQPRPRRKASAGFSLMRRAPPDEDEHLQQARFELTKLEALFFECAKGVDKVARTRRAHGQVQAELGNKLVGFATTEVHPPLGNALRKLGRLSHVEGEVSTAESMSECTILGDTLGYLGMNSKSAKETLQNRSLVLEEYQAAVKSAISKRRNIERLKASTSIRPDRVDEALEDLEEANKHEQTLALRADGISQNLHRALTTHARQVDSDLASALIEHARVKIAWERGLLRELESVRGDVIGANKTFTGGKNTGGLGAGGRQPEAREFQVPITYETVRERVAESGVVVERRAGVPMPGDGQRYAQDGQRYVAPGQGQGMPQTPGDGQKYFAQGQGVPRGPAPGPLQGGPGPLQGAPSPRMPIAGGFQFQPQVQPQADLPPQSPGAGSSRGPATPIQQHYSSPVLPGSPLQIQQQQADPLSFGTQSMFISPSNSGGGGGVDPLSQSMTQTMRIPAQNQNQRRRLDAREAASKLANFL